MEYTKIMPCKMTDIKGNEHEVKFHIRYRDEYRKPVNVGPFITQAPSVEVIAIMAEPPRLCFKEIMMFTPDPISHSPHQLERPGNTQVDYFRNHDLEENTMKIIKQGSLKNHYRIVCDDCKSELEAEENEITFSTSPKNEAFIRFDCPVCRKNTMTTNYRKAD